MSALVLLPGEGKSVQICGAGLGVVFKLFSVWVDRDSPSERITCNQDPFNYNMNVTDQDRTCHPSLRSGSRYLANQILRCAQDDMLSPFQIGLPILIVKNHYAGGQRLPEAGAILCVETSRAFTTSTRPRPRKKSVQPHYSSCARSAASTSRRKPTKPHSLLPLTR